MADVQHRRAAACVCDIRILLSAFWQHIIQHIVFMAILLFLHYLSAMYVLYHRKDHLSIGSDYNRQDAQYLPGMLTGYPAQKNCPFWGQLVRGYLGRKKAFLFFA